MDYRGSPRREGSGALKEELGVWNSWGGGKNKLFFSSTFLSLSHIKRFFFFFSLSLELMIAQQTTQFKFLLRIIWASLVAQLVKNLSAMWETWVWSLGPEDPLKQELATHSSILAWRIPWTKEPGGLQSMGLQRVGHDYIQDYITTIYSAWGQFLLPENLLANPVILKCKLREWV